MKKFIILVLSAILTVSSVDCTFADSIYVQSSETEYLGDGLYLTITLNVEEVPSVARELASKRATKVYTITNSSGEKQAEYKLTGSFLYSNSGSSCISSSHDTIIYDSECKFSSATSSHSGNVAIGEFTCKRYFLGISIQTVTQKLTLSCNKNGNIF